MTLYLLRHDDVGQSERCYGQSDFLPLNAFATTAQKVKPQLPASPTQVISSPLKRCLGLAQALYPTHKINLQTALQEIHFGDWENTPWQAIDRTLLDAWAQTPLSFQFPSGESIAAFEQRVTSAITGIAQQAKGDVVIVTHAGVIRLWLAIAEQRPWAELLNRPIPYASVWTV